MGIVYQSIATEKYWKLYRKLPDEAKKHAKDAYKRFCIDPSDPGLNFERVQSNKKFCTVRVNLQYRVVGLWGSPITWFWIGTHQEFDNMF